MDFDLDEPEDAILLLAVLDDEGSDGRDGSAARAPARRASVPGSAPRAGCGCGGCLLPALAIAGAFAVGAGMVPPAAILGSLLALHALVDRPRTSC